MFLWECPASRARYGPSRPRRILLFILSINLDFFSGHICTSNTVLIIRTTRNDSFSSRRRSPTCLTIHNLAYQGVFPASQYALTNLPWEYFNPESLEFYGQMNCLKGGIAYAGILTTVSPRYALEITTEEFGCGLDGFLRKRQN